MIYRSKEHGVRSMLVLTVFVLLTSYFLLPTSVRAQEIDLLWQGDVYAPPFYQGRSLWSEQSFITLYAVPNIPGYSNLSNLDYKWSKNSEVLGVSSGIRRNSISFSDSVFSKPVNIKIEILGPDGGLLATRQVIIKPEDTRLFVYENSPLYGILFHREVGTSYSINGNEVTFAAFPAFFDSLSRISDDLTYYWSSNAGTGDNSSSVTYRVPEGVSGSSRVNVRTSHSNHFKQGKERGFLIQFVNKNGDL